MTGTDGKGKEAFFGTGWMVGVEWRETQGKKERDGADLGYPNRSGRGPRPRFIDLKSDIVLKEKVEEDAELCVNSTHAHLPMVVVENVVGVVVVVRSELL